MSLEVRRFGPTGREMVGLLLRRRDGSRPRPGFLLCRPLGQEATRTASMYRVIADRLAREGSNVFTFDYHGTGDSPGEESEQSLAEWSKDIEAAHRVAAADAGPVMHWFAMGLACHAALRAAARLEAPPAHLVLWEPVLDRPAYMHRMLDAHREELSHEFEAPWDRLIRQGQAAEPEIPGDVLGFQIGPPLAGEISELASLPLAAALRRGVTVTCGIHAESEARLRELTGAQLIRLCRIETHINWMLSQAMGSAIVPPEVMPALNETFA